MSDVRNSMPDTQRASLSETARASATMATAAAAHAAAVEKEAAGASLAVEAAVASAREAARLFEEVQDVRSLMRWLRSTYEARTLWNPQVAAAAYRYTPRTATRYAP